MKAEFKSKESASDYDEIFLQHYHNIYQWGLRMTKYNHELAEDLVHDVYMRFTAARHNFDDVTSLDSYLYVTLRNSYYSYLRHTSEQRKRFVIVQFDLIDSDLLQTNPQQQFQIRENLRSICRYACFRKKTSLSASVLILRFFHGYFPSELALILRSSRNVIEARLMSARREAAAYLNNPESLSALAQNSISKDLAINNFPVYQDIVEDLRETIFALRDGECLQPEDLLKIYQTGESKITRNNLSHLVSCPFCLTVVNEILGLPPLSERHPLDALGKEIVINKKASSKTQNISYGVGITSALTGVWMWLPWAIGDAFFQMCQIVPFSEIFEQLNF